MPNPRPPWLCAALLLAAPALAQGGRELFAQHCATCHGALGRGDGPTKVEPRPRDLTAGRFSFGTSRDALQRTIRAGIAPAMPAFGDLLGDDQVRALVDHVLALMPAAAEAAPEQSRMRFDRRPRLARGYLPPRADGEPPLARGLVAGLPNGFVLEYRTDDLRLLRTFVDGVDGAFVDRTDWRGRGGSPLEPLGTPLDELPARDFGPVEITGAGIAMRVALRDTRVDGELLQFDGELLHGATRLARWREQVRAVAVGGGTGFHRRIELSEPSRADSVLLSTAGLALVGTRRHERSTVPGREVWYGGVGGGGQVEVLGVRGPQTIKTTIRAGSGKAAVPIGDRPLTRVDVLRLRLPDFDVSRVATYAEAFDR